MNTIVSAKDDEDKHLKIEELET